MEGRSSSEAQLATALADERAQRRQLEQQLRQVTCLLLHRGAVTQQRVNVLQQHMIGDVS